MPFDATPQNTVADVLRRARALIENPKDWSCHGGGWAEHVYCSGRAILATSDGGYGHWRYPEDDGALRVFCKALSLRPSLGAVVAWNDAPHRTHAEVLAAFDNAIAIAESGQ